MKKISTVMLAKLAIVAALYVALTYASYPLAYGGLQFRISEMLILLVFFRKEYSISLIIGCLLVNLSSPLGMIDVFVGTSATALSCLFIALSKNIIVASLYPVIINGIFVGLEIVLIDNLTPFWSNLFIMGGGVAFGELVVITIAGVIIFTLLRKNEKFMQLIEANQNYQKES